MSRLYGRILKDIVNREYDIHQVEEQNGFRASTSTIDSIFPITQTIEKKTARSLETHLLFVDLTKAYDTVPVNKLWEVLEGTCISATVINAIKNLYEDSTSKVKNGKYISTG